MGHPRRRSSRHAARLLAALAGAALIAACSRPGSVERENCGLKTRPRRLLTAGEPASAELARSTEHSFDLELEGGTYLVLEARQRGADLALEVCDPHGRRIAYVDTYIDLSAPETAELIAEGSGRYRVGVTAAFDSPAGGYELAMSTLRTASKADRERVRLRDEATRAQAKGDVRRAIADWKELGDPAAEAEARQALAEELARLPGSDAEALAELGRVRDLRRAAGNRLGEAAAAELECRQLFDSERYAEALAPCTAARDLAASAGDGRARVRGLINLATLAGKLGTPPEACEAMLGSAVELAGRIGVPYLECRALRAMGTFLGNQGRSHEAIAIQESAVLRCDAAGKGEERDRVLVRNDLGVEWLALGDSWRARQYRRDAIDVARELGQRELEGPLLLNEGTLLFSLGRQEAARDSYQAAERAFVAQGDIRGQVLTELRRAVLAVESGQPRDALRRVEAAQALLARAAKRREPDLELDAQITLGRALRDLGEVKRAEGPLREAVAESRRLENRRREMFALGHLGETLRLQGDYAGAEESFAGARAAAAAMGELSFAAWVDWHFALLRRDQGDHAGARQLSTEAVKAFELVNRATGDPESRATQLAFRRPLYETAIRAALDDDCHTSRRGCAAAALELSERARARGLLAVLSERELDLDGELPLDLRQQKLRAEARHQSLLREEIDLRRLNPNQPLPASLEAELRAVDRELETVSGRIRESNPRFASLRDLEPLTAGEIQRRVVRHRDTALLEFALGAEGSQLFVVRATGVEVVALPGVDQLAAIVAPFLGRLRERAGTRAEEAAALYDALLRPAEPWLSGVSQLIIIPDGLLAELPFEALVSGRGEDGSIEHLVDHMAVSYAASASVLASVARPAAPIPRTPPLFVAFANPFYPLPEAREERREEAPPSEQLTPPRSGALRGGIALPRLEGSQREVEVIAQQFASRFGGAVEQDCPRFTAGLAAPRAGPRPTSCLFLRKDAREEFVSSPLVSEARYLHFAVHAISDDHDPDRVGLFLSQERAGNKNGLLELREIAELRLDAELVVLSACSSGLGVRLRGEGFLGFTWAFLRAGARSLVVSLWDVDDSDAAILMERFYEHLLADSKADKAEALRRAKLDLIQRGSPDAYSWAAFVLIGER